MLHGGRRRAGARDRAVRDLLGLSLDQLSRLLEAETARAELRREWQLAESGVQRRRILAEALEHVGTQLDLVRDRRVELEQLEAELEAKRVSLHERLAELDA